MFDHFDGIIVVMKGEKDIDDDKWHQKNRRHQMTKLKNEDINRRQRKKNILFRTNYPKSNNNIALNISLYLKSSITGFQFLNHMLNCVRLKKIKEVFSKFD